MRHLMNRVWREVLKSASEKREVQTNHTIRRAGVDSPFVTLRCEVVGEIHQQVVAESKKPARC
ncbi:uncharacterized protein V6R79_019093 [Siganus canaliculatus]